jgi:DNA-directed RNA polymerase subunit RPC12/RpoP
MVGMGSLVARPVPDFALVIGRPARLVGWVCRCGEPFARGDAGSLAEVPETACPACGLRYRVDGGRVAEIDPPA